MPRKLKKISNWYVWTLHSTISTANNNINLELRNKKEQTPDSLFSAKSTSVESAISMETAETLSGKKHSGRECIEITRLW